jgi:hypothetical protein
MRLGKISENKNIVVWTVFDWTHCLICARWNKNQILNTTILDHPCLKIIASKMIASKIKKNQYFVQNHLRRGNTPFWNFQVLKLGSCRDLQKLFLKFIWEMHTFLFNQKNYIFSVKQNKFLGVDRRRNLSSSSKHVY